MRTFSRTGARHFCQSFSGKRAAAQSADAYLKSFLGRKPSISEGDPFFEGFRDCLLREADQNLFLAVSCFRRSFDLLTASSSFWALVTLYYSGFYSARAILGMFGCSVHENRWVMEVSVDAAGKQTIKKNQHSSTRNGPHQFFWDEYYDGMGPASSWVDASMILAVEPVSNDPIWPITTRNEVNYRTPITMKAVSDFQKSFDATKFPATLPGVLGTQFKLSKALVLFAMQTAKDFGLNTDAHGALGRGTAIRQQIFEATLPDMKAHLMQGELSI